MTIPNLIETNTKLFLFNSLNNCHQHRVNLYYYLLYLYVFFFIYNNCLFYIILLFK